jgi:hypothetical protein
LLACLAPTRNTDEPRAKRAGSYAQDDVDWKNDLQIISALTMLWRGDLAGDSVVSASSTNACGTALLRICASDRRAIVDDISDHVEQLLRVDWFGQVADKSRCQRALTVFRPSVPGEGDE